MPRLAAARPRLASAAPLAAPAGAPAPPSATALLFLRGRDADGRIRSLVAGRRALRPLLGTLALSLLRCRRYQALGFRSLADYARERLGVTGHVVREWARVVEALAALPCLRAAVMSGDVSWSVARRAVSRAAPETDADFAEGLRGRTVRAAEEMLRAAFGARAEVPEETDREARVRVSVPLSPPRQGRWALALELARRVAGESLPVWECAEAIAAEALAALPPEIVAQSAASCVPPMEPSALKPMRPRRVDGSRDASQEHGLRHAAFQGLRWDLPDSMDEARCSRLAAWAGAASPHALDRALRRAMRQLQRLDHDLAHLLRHVLERRLFRELGFPSFERYAEERADLSPRTARRHVRMARLGPVGSAVAQALRNGRLTPRQAEVVAGAVPPSHQSAAVAFARTVTLRRLEEEHGAGSTAAGGVTFYAPPMAASVFRLGLDAARLHLETRAAQPAAPSEALAWMLEHAIATWQEQGALFTDYADFVRDGFRCTAPGCTARRNLHSHHIVFLSAGGPDEAWNRTTLCASHHLRGVHAGTVGCRGHAPEGLVFELGLRTSGPPLLRAGAGDVLLAP